MKIYFSAPSSSLKQIKACNVNRMLLSFAVDAKKLCKTFTNNEDILIDSGAFSVWNSGKKVNIDDYLNFIKNLPQHWYFMNLDVIPETPSLKDWELSVQLGYENYLYLSSKIKNILPVYHYGEDIKILEKYCSMTKHIAIGPKRGNTIPMETYYDTVFQLTGKKIKVHALGMTDYDIMLQFPFYSVDSITYKRYRLITGCMYYAQGKLEALLYENIRYWLYLEKQITKIWESRGVKWD